MTKTSSLTIFKTCQNDSDGNAFLTERQRNSRRRNLKWTVCLYLLFLQLESTLAYARSQPHLLLSYHFPRQRWCRVKFSMRLTSRQNLRCIITSLIFTSDGLYNSPTRRDIAVPRGVKREPLKVFSASESWGQRRCRQRHQKSQTLQPYRFHYYCYARAQSKINCS